MKRPSEIDNDLMFFEGQQVVITNVLTHMVEDMRLYTSELSVLQAWVRDSMLTPLEAAHAGIALDEVMYER
jgi:hypothetical protein